MSQNLTQSLCRSFSSIESLKKQYIATAQSMFGPGFVWLIRNHSSRGKMPNESDSDPVYDPEFTLLCTYIAGSPLPHAHPRAQTMDMNTENSVTGMTTAGKVGPYSGNASSNVPPGRIFEAEICLGVCTWEHCWIYDHGVDGEAKRRYLEAWWDCIDWNVVERQSALLTDRFRYRTPTNSPIPQSFISLR